MSELTNQQKIIANKVLELYLPIHSRMVANSRWKNNMKTKAMDKFFEWVGKYARTARNPTNKNINTAYKNKFH